MDSKKLNLTFLIFIAVSTHDKITKYFLLKQDEDRILLLG